MVSGANLNLFSKYQSMQGINSNPFSSQKVGGHNPAVEGEYGSKNTKAVGSNYNEYATNQDLYSRMQALDGRDRSPESRNEFQGQRLFCMA